MSPLASTFITLALASYTIGVWAERLQKRLKWWHFAFFVLGLAFDTLGTGLMFEYVGGMTADVHGISGLIAILPDPPSNASYERQPCMPLCSISRLMMPRSFTRRPRISRRPAASS